VGLWSEAGLLAPGPTIRAFPIRRAADQWLRLVALRLAPPVTVAGPRRIRTGFPSPPTVIYEAILQGGEVRIEARELLALSLV
jgi:hypothetical protein